jgi:hypothetical protein
MKDILFITCIFFDQKLCFEQTDFLESLARSISEGFSEAFNDFEGAMKSIAKEIDYLVAEGSSESREKTSSSSSISKSSSNTVSSIESASEKKWRTIFNFLSYESLLCGMCDMTNSLNERERESGVDHQSLVTVVSFTNTWNWYSECLSCDCRWRCY